MGVPWRSKHCLFRDGEPKAAQPAGQVDVTNAVESEELNLGVTLSSSIRNAFCIAGGSGRLAADAQKLVT